MFFKAEKKLGSHAVSTLDLLLCPLERGKSRLVHVGEPGQALSMPSTAFPKPRVPVLRLQAKTESPHTCTLSKHTGSTHTAFPIEKLPVYTTKLERGVSNIIKSNNSNYPILLNFYF